MKVIDHIEQRKSTLFSFEILPPLKGQSIESIFSAIDPLMEFNPVFIDVTYHREDVYYKKHSNGLLEKKAVKKRPGTVGICAALMNRYRIDTVPHIICGGFTKEETENALIDLNFLGIQNVLVLRGDSIKSERNFTPEPEGHCYASNLLKQVININKGNYLDETLENTSKTNFCIGVAAYPEKHFESPNMNDDLYYLKQKVDIGANYIITQMFFDNEKFFDFQQKCIDVGINIPIIPGLKPLTTIKQLVSLPSIFHIDIPEDLVKEARKCENNQQVREIGVEWGIQQAKELIAKGVPCLHYYSMGKSSSVRKIAEQLF